MPLPSRLLYCYQSLLLLVAASPSRQVYTVAISSKSPAQVLPRGACLGAALEVVLEAVRPGALWEGDNLLVASPALGEGEVGPHEREATEGVGS